jgi:tRNA (guanine-N7-)-methyltransferase
LRLRKDPNAYEKLIKSKIFIENPEEYKGNWKGYFGNTNPVHIEIGPGKGQFIISLAQKNAHINYIALEKVPTVLSKLVKKIPEQGLSNLAAVSKDAQLLDEIFEPGELDKLYLNFSDPWPKNRHEKRRLTSPSFLSLYKRILKPGSTIEFKTDNRDFFDYSIEQFKTAGYSIVNFTYNLYHSDMLEDNIATEYEEKFHNLGVPINKLVAKI